MLIGSSHAKSSQTGCQPARNACDSVVAFIAGKSHCGAVMRGNRGVQRDELTEPQGFNAGHHQNSIEVIVCSA